MAKSDEEAWIKADKRFQDHRVNCRTCRFNIRQQTIRLCAEGQELWVEAERLLAVVDPGSRK